MDTFTLFDIEDSSNCYLKPRAPNTDVEITRDGRLTLEWDKMFAQYVILLSKFKSEEQSC